MSFTADRCFKKKPRIIAKASGTYVEDAERRRIFDGLSDLWCSGIGQFRPEITAAIPERALTLHYVPALQFGRPKALGASGAWLQ